MNTSNILNVLLAVALVILSVKIAFFDNNSPSAEAKQQDGNAAIDNIMSRVSVRDYTDQPVDSATVDTLLRAGMAAPSAGNKQPWKFVVVTDKAVLGKMSSTIKTMGMAEKAPMAIVVCGDLDNTFPEDGRDYWVEDASAATENILLAAHSMGLGAVWCGVYPMKERVAFIKELLGLPESIVPLNVIPMGYPAESPEPKDKWKPENVHYERWNNADSDGTTGATATNTEKDSREE